MSQPQGIGFAFSKITTDEFAITGETFDTTSDTSMNMNFTYGFNQAEQMIAMKVNCIFVQREKVILLIEVSCLFKIAVEHWPLLYNQEGNTLTLPHLAAMHFASLTVSTARGVLHGKTENLPINALIIPPINLNDFFKGDLMMNPATHAQPENK
jgi:hypothetical protein